MATSAIDMANEAMSNQRSTGDGEVDEAPRGGTLAAPGNSARISGRGQAAINSAKSPAEYEPPAITIDVTLISRVVRLELSNAPFNEVQAANDPDTGVITVRIGCQSNPVARWRRVGPKLIERHFGADAVERYSKALTEVLNQIEAKFAPDSIVSFPPSTHWDGSDFGGGSTPPNRRY